MARFFDDVGRQGGFSQVVTVEHNTGIGVAYADLDVISGTGLEGYIKIPNCLRQNEGRNTGNTAVLLSVAIVDRAKQGAAMNILLFNSPPQVISIDNAALNISDADMASKFIGRVAVAATDYINISASSTGCVKNIGLVCKADGNDLYAVLESAGTPTYTGLHDLVISYGFLQD